MRHGSRGGRFVESYDTEVWPFRGMTLDGGNEEEDAAVARAEVVMEAARESSRRGDGSFLPDNAVVSRGLTG